QGNALIGSGRPVAGRLVVQEDHLRARVLRRLDLRGRLAGSTPPDQHSRVCGAGQLGRRTVAAVEERQLLGADVHGPGRALGGRGQAEGGAVAGRVDGQLRLGEVPALYDLEGAVGNLSEVLHVDSVRDPAVVGPAGDRVPVADLAVPGDPDALRVGPQ